MHHQTPNPETPTARHLSSSESRGPTLPRQPRDFADRESTIQGFLMDENPERRTPNLDSCHLSAMINGSRYFGKSRLGSSWGIDSCITKPRTPISRTPKPRCHSVCFPWRDLCLDTCLHLVLSGFRDLGVRASPPP
jgi:hypothetical protein